MSAQLIKAVATRYPNISLHIIEAMTGTLDEWVQLGRLDVVLLYDHKPFPNVAWTEMMVEDLMLIADSKNPIRKRASIRFSELENLAIVLPAIRMSYAM
jgi:LysR family nitrogen assimilation transcriptional regulator